MLVGFFISAMYNVRTCTRSDSRQAQVPKPPVGTYIHMCVYIYVGGLILRILCKFVFVVWHIPTSMKTYMIKQL